jgi:hypothetical protein
MNGSAMLLVGIVTFLQVIITGFGTSYISAAVVTD